MTIKRPRITAKRTKKKRTSTIKGLMKNLDTLWNRDRRRVKEIARLESVIRELEVRCYGEPMSLAELVACGNEIAQLVDDLGTIEYYAVRGCDRKDASYRLDTHLLYEEMYVMAFLTVMGA